MLCSSEYQTMEKPKIHQYRVFIKAAKFNMFAGAFEYVAFQETPQT
jgi:hypothetical protein